LHQRNVNVTNYQNEMESMNKISLMLNDLIKQELTRNIILIAIARVYYVRARARVCVCVCVCVCVYVQYIALVIEILMDFLTLYK